MDAEQTPMFLLADSQLLFPRGGENSFMDRVKATLDVKPNRAKAAYLGASNGDRPEFYDLFRAAMGGIGVVDCKHVPARPAAADKAFLEQADVIVLAGGDVGVGWRAFEEAGLVELLRRAPSRGAALIGVSAGAVHMGMSAAGAGDTTLTLLSLVPYAVGVHDEPEWTSLVPLVRNGGGHVIGLGIPWGGGVIAHPDGSIEPFRKPITEVVATGAVVRIREVIWEKLTADSSQPTAPGRPE
jgi:hypothetical protein